MRPIVIATLAPALLATAAPAPARLPVAITAALADSAVGWNIGDLGRFVAIYAPDAIFVTRAGLLRGRAAIEGHYRATFAGGRNTRGRLSFTIVQEKPIDQAHMLVFARYRLEGVGAGEDGPTTLLFERRRDGWRIAADHSS